MPGHFHDDCLSGLPYLHQRGARSIAGKKTVDICKAKGLVLPQNSFRKRKKIKFGTSRVELRYFAGLTLRQAAEVLGVSPRTADSDWAYAKAWLLAELGAGDP